MSGAIAIELDRESERKLKNLSRTVPGIYTMAQGRAAVALTKEFSGIMRNGGNPKRGVPRLPRLSQLTEAVKARDGVVSRNSNGGAYKSPKMFDGRRVALATNTRLHVHYVKGGTQHVGFHEHLQEWLERALDDSRNKFSTAQRRMFYARYGIKDVPSDYDRPRRHIIEPWSAYLRSGHYADVLVGNFNRLAAGRIH